MNRLKLLLICAGLSGASIASAGAQTTPAAPAAPAAASATGGATVTLKPPNNQGPTASAVIAQQGNDVVITLHAPTDDTTAAVFSGTCTANSGKPKANGPATALKPLANGASQTVIPNTKVTDLTATPHAIVVQGGNVSPLCGDVSAVSPPSNP